MNVNEIDFELGEDELIGLPGSLVDELKFGGAKRHQTILTVMMENGGGASLDQLLVRFWRKTEQQLTRQQLVATLHRMSEKDMIDRAKGKQGVYLIKGLQDENTARGSVPIGVSVS